MASTAMASPALARDNSWYIGGEFGPMLVENTELTTVDEDDDGMVTLEFNEGFDGGGYVGYDFGAFRLEAEVSYREADHREAAIGTPVLAEFPADGSTSSLAFMLNGLFDFGPDDGLQVYAGGGIGIARTSIDGEIFIPRVTNPVIDDSSSGLAWQLLAGVQAPLTDTIDVGLRYRLFTAEDVDIVDAAGTAWDGKFRSHSLMGTLAFNFGAPVPPPPPPPPLSA